MEDKLDSSSSEDETGDGRMADRESESETEEEEEDGVPDVEHHSRSYAKYVAAQYQQLYSRHYLKQHRRRTAHERGPARLPHVLSYVKDNSLEDFRSVLLVSPSTFDKLVGEIEEDLVFSNNSQNEQIPISHQLAVTLFRFGHSGNAESIKRVADWSGYGKGTVLLITQRVLTALLRRDFLDKAVRPPTAEEEEEAKQWVEDHSCYAWRNGWLFVDGTLIPLYFRPFWYAEAYFDRKSNYSLNIQVSCTVLLLKHC